LGGAELIGSQADIGQPKITATSGPVVVLCLFSRPAFRPQALSTGGCQGNPGLVLIRLILKLLADRMPTAR